jgi:uncharacterized repeat protein (TIGR03803 family)
LTFKNCASHVSGKRGLSKAICLTVLCCAVTAFATAELATAQSYRVLYTFAGTPDGASPIQSDLIDVNGTFFGTTNAGGDYGFGTIFQLNGLGEETVLYSFTGGTDGAFPDAGLVRDSAGNMYGTTEHGGNLSCAIGNSIGCGVVYKISSTAQFSVLYAFTDKTDGAWPQGLIMDSVGNLYGTTAFGGDLTCTIELPYGCGVVYRLDSNGNLTSLYSFSDGPGGTLPDGFLTLDASGNLYGATSSGGILTYCPDIGCGVLYKLDTSGNETVLYSFTNRTDGGNPLGHLQLDSEGNVYGTTYQGGDLSCSGLRFTLGCGVVFEVTPSGKEKILHTFTGADGANPGFGLLRNSSGNFYGTTVYGGVENMGTVFEVGAKGGERVVYSFTGAADGGLPQSGITLDAKGNLYSSTSSGGDLACNPPAGCGTLFRMRP